MKRTFILLMSAAALIAVLAVLPWTMAPGSAAWAQGDNPGCSLRVTGDDTGCTASLACNSSDGCTAYPFHYTCGGFKIFASVTCENEWTCPHCAACVAIYTNPPGPQPVAWCDNLQQCSQAQCSKTSPALNLAAGDYIMYVCLLSCPNSDCQSCEFNHCTAHGCIFNGALTCP
jgi:hypothetical protein